MSEIQNDSKETTPANLRGALFQQATTAMACLDKQGKWLEVNNRLLDLLGYTKEGLMHEHTFQDLVSSSSLSACRIDAPLEWLRNDSHSADISKSTTCPLFKKDGSVIWCRLTRTFIENEGGESRILLELQPIRNKSIEHPELNKYTELANATELSVAISDQNNVIQWVNQGFKSATGLTEQQVRGYTSEEIWDQFLDATITNSDQSGQQLSSDKSISLTVWYEHAKEGYQACQRVHITPVQNEEDQHIGYISIGTDITQQKQNENTLYRFKAAIDSSIDGIAVLDENMKYEYVNKAHAQIYGYEDPGDLMGQSWKLLYEEEEVNRIEEEVVNALYAKGHWLGEAVGKRKDGTTFDQELSLTTTDNGEIVCVVRDISNYKQLLNQLKLQNENLRYAQELADIGFWHHNLTTGDSGLSHGAARIHGIPEEEAKHYSFEDYRNLVHEEDLQILDQAVEQLREKGESFHITYCIHRASDGALRYIENLGTKTESEPNKQELYFGVYRDITELKQREYELEESRDQTETMLREVHHRIKNNLASVSGLLELESYEVEDENARHALTDSLLRIRSMAKVHEALHKSPSISNINLEEYIGNLAQAVEQTQNSQQQNIDLDLQIDSNIKVSTEQAVPTALLVNELLLNAYEHAFEGREEGKIEVEANEDGNQITLTVADDGMGIDMNEWEESDSLGRSIINNICQQLEADLDITTDGGTNFSIVFENKIDS